MFRIGISILLSFLLLQDVLSQSKLTKQKLEVWNSADQKWRVDQIFTWQYDLAGQEIEYHVLSGYKSESTFKYELLIRNIYNEDGVLDAKETRRVDFAGVYDERLEYLYDSQNQIIEERKFIKHQDTQIFRESTKKTYEYQNGGRKTIILESRWSFGQQRYWLEKQEEIFKDDNNCIIEHSQIQYESFFRANRYIYTRDNECRILSSEWQKKESSNDPFVPYLKEKINYLDGGKKMTMAYERYQDPGIWDYYGQREIEYNDQGLEIRNKYIDLKSMPPWELLVTQRYDEEGRNLEIHTYLDNVLTNLDSSVFEFNEQNWVISHSRIRQNFVQGSTKTSQSFYTHYCDGQVKTYRFDDLPESYRVSYEYTTGEDCLLENEDATVLVFPNPARRKIEISSNLLLGETAIVNIFASDGRKVYAQQVNSYTEQIEIDVSGFLSGNYYLSIQNGKRSASKRILILE